MASYVGLTCPCNPSRCGNCCSCRLSLPYLANHLILYALLNGFSKSQTHRQEQQLKKKFQPYLLFAQYPPAVQFRCVVASVLWSSAVTRCSSHGNSLSLKGICNRRTKKCNCTPYYLPMGNFILLSLVLLLPCYVVFASLWHLVTWLMFQIPENNPRTILPVFVIAQPLLQCRTSRSYI